MTKDAIRKLIIPNTDKSKSKSEINPKSKQLKNKANRQRNPEQPQTNLERRTLASKIQDDDDAECWRIWWK